MVKGRASKTPPEIERCYWLLSESETEECLCAVLGYSKKNDSFSENNPDNSENNDTKKSKGNQSKQNYYSARNARKKESGNSSFDVDDFFQAALQRPFCKEE